jgi:hypothetical protein
MNWLVMTLAPVIMGVKPAEILSFPNSENNIEEKLLKIKKHFEICKKIKYEIIKVENRSVKIIFYNESALENALSDNRNKKFLINLGYPKDYNMYGYLMYMVKRIESGSIPDEIGVFLGYPLKDVMGFIGHPSLKLTKVNKWRIYGDSKISDSIVIKFQAAKEQLSHMLEYNELEDILRAI